MFSLRGALFPFVPLPLLISAYERHGGHAIDLARIRFYRALVTLGSLNDMHGQLVQSREVFAGNVGRVFAYYFGLLTLIVKGLAEAEGMELKPVTMPEVRIRDWDRLYDLVQGEIENNIAPRTSDPAAADRVNALVKVMRYWQGREKFGAVFDAEETADIEDLLGDRFGSLGAARAAFAAAIRADRVNLAEAVRVCCRRVAREIEMARPGLGSLADSAYPALT